MSILLAEEASIYENKSRSQKGEAYALYSQLIDWL